MLLTQMLNDSVNRSHLKADSQIPFSFAVATGVDLEDRSPQHRRVMPRTGSMLFWLQRQTQASVELFRGFYVANIKGYEIQLWLRHP